MQQQGTTPQEDENKSIYDNTELSELVERTLMPLSILQTAPEEPSNANTEDTSYGLPQSGFQAVDAQSQSLTFVMENIVIEEEKPEPDTQTEPRLKEIKGRGKHSGPETKFQSFFVLKK